MKSRRRTDSGTLSRASCGVPVADVADFPGDDEDTVREHYARWVPERQARLTGILKDAFDDKPEPKLVIIPRR